MNRIESNRSQALMSKAVQLDMAYHATDEFGLYRLLKDFKLFKRGRRRRLHHILAKTNELSKKTYIFDYSYVIGKNNSRKYKKQTVLFLNSKNLGLPQFQMEPEQLWHKLTTWLKIQADIDFLDHPEFSEQYLLSGEDEALIRHLFNPDVLHFFSMHKNWHIEGIGYFLIFYSHNERFHPEVFPGFLNMGNQLHALFELHPDALNLNSDT